MAPIPVSMAWKDLIVVTDGQALQNFSGPPVWRSLGETMFFVRFEDGIAALIAAKKDDAVWYWRRNPVDHFRFPKTICTILPA
ncbi:MAG TPA: hypothetical protein VFS75_03290 [Candidatus Paceibacterota bacterium]|nr:hypothetical protein [Candidatus Paceibacterota bacterium]